MPVPIAVRPGSRNPRITTPKNHPDITNRLLRSTLFAMIPIQRLPVYLIVFAAISGLVFAQTSSKQAAGVEQKDFGTRDGRPIILYKLTNAHGVEVQAMNYGGIIVSL